LPMLPMTTIDVPRIVRVPTAPPRLFAPDSASYVVPPAGGDVASSGGGAAGGGCPGPGGGGCGTAGGAVVVADAFALGFGDALGDRSGGGSSDGYSSIGGSPVPADRPRLTGGCPPAGRTTQTPSTSSTQPATAVATIMAMPRTSKRIGRRRRPRYLSSSSTGLGRQAKPRGPDLSSGTTGRTSTRSPVSSIAGRRYRVPITKANGRRRSRGAV